MRIFFATDLHGSERCYRKFLNAKAFYQADFLILGGDLTGKAILPIIKTKPKEDQTRFLNQDRNINEKDLPTLIKQVQDTGLYPYITEKEEVELLRENLQQSKELFERLIQERLTNWINLAEERLKPSGIPLYIIPGNDDSWGIDRILSQSKWCINLARQRQLLGNGFEIVGLDYSNPTPWDSPRELEDDALMEKIEATLVDVAFMDRCIFNFHCPPRDTSLDKAPKLTVDLKPIMAGGQMMMESVGSRSVRTAIQKYQPLLGLHGHVHESRASVTLGHTLCLNPGSEYSDGFLRGAIIDIENERVARYQFTSG